MVMFTYVYTCISIIFAYSFVHVHTHTVGAVNVYMSKSSRVDKLINLKVYDTSIYISYNKVIKSDIKRVK